MEQFIFRLSKSSNYAFVIVFTVLAMLLGFDYFKPIEMTKFIVVALFPFQVALVIFDIILWFVRRQIERKRRDSIS